ncbi:MAG: YicC/YloC family endoribonuclease [Planctomycetota bacterium]|jgi:uncharacterized protein (TIGR00255 family)
MINSMTGYGDAEGQFDDITYVVEIKTINNRYFKARVKLPESMAFLEDNIEKLLAKELSRGTINYSLRLKNVSANALFDIDDIALKTYMARLNEIASSIDIKCPIDMAGLLGLPGMLVPVSQDNETAGQIREKVLSISQEAVGKLKQMRAAEGVALAADLDKHCEAIKQALKQICARSQVVPQEYKQKIKKRVDELLGDGKLKLDESTLAREVAVLAERSDISEEVARLDSHLQQFAQSCEGAAVDKKRRDTSVRADNQIGRKLDFISQEMLREANTIASKTSDIEIIRWVVDIKCRIDRIKEQVQNVE